MAGKPPLRSTANQSISGGLRPLRKRARNTCEPPSITSGSSRMDNLPAVVQTELSLLGLLKSPDDIRMDVLRTFGDAEDTAVSFAIRWAWDHRRCKPMSQA